MSLTLLPSGALHTDDEPTLNSTYCLRIKVLKCRPALRATVHHYKGFD